MKCRNRRLVFEQLDSRSMLSAIDLIDQVADTYGPVELVLPSISSTHKLIEIQAWLRTGHFHNTLVFPLGQSVSGELKLNMRIVLHDTDSFIKHVRVDVRNGKSGIFWAKNIKLAIPPGQHDAAYDMPITINTRQIKEGGQSLSFRVISKDPITKLDWSTSSEIPIIVDNILGNNIKWYGDRHVGIAGMDSFMAKAWNAKLGYTRILVDDLPTHPVNEPFTVKIKGLTEVSSKDRNKLGVWTVTLNRSHYIPPTEYWSATQPDTGILLLERLGKARDEFDLNIDPIALGLPQGEHNFSVRYDDLRKFSGVSTQSVVAKVWFKVL